MIFECWNEDEMVKKVWVFEEGEYMSIYKELLQEGYYFIVSSMIETDEEGSILGRFMLN